MHEDERERRTLTDADVAALTKSLTDTFEANFYKNLGKGVWSMFQKAFIVVVVMVAAIGYYKGH